MSSYIFINSNDRLYKSSSSPSDFLIQINTAASEMPKTSLSLEQISFLNLEYGINSNNNTLVFRENSDDVTSFTITIPEGNYTSTTFPTALKTAMDAAGANTYTVTYSSTTGKLNITTTIPDTFKLVSGSLLNYIGYEATSFLTAHSALFPLNLSGSSYVDVCLGLLNRNMKTGINYGRVFARIPLNVGFGSLISYVNYSDKDDVTISSDELDELRIQLFDDQNKLLVLPNNCVVSIVLKVASIF